MVCFIYCDGYFLVLFIGLMLLDGGFQPPSGVEENLS